MKDLENWQDEFKICCYAKKLFDKVTHLNNILKVPPVDITEVKKAIYYAKKYHGSQMRQSGEPFYSHPIEVAYMISDYLFRTDVIVTSILHDTIEDTELTKEKIAVLFGDKVSGQVMDLTRIKENGIKISSAEMVAMLYKEKKHDVLLIKLFDRLHNMQSIGVKSPEKIKKIVDETIKSFITVSIHLEYQTHGLSNISDIMAELCYQNSHVTRCILDQIIFKDNYQLPFPTAQNTIIHNYIRHILV
ncbi:guanosine polyphosphate pyrophosphohydrolase [Rickettsia rhipicephali]|uniref:HD domain-containing protein n=1 Tax=Rickettsia rhipicephali TaxID=33992 RepID=UPI00070CFA92|nr:HD domain-containing protein [Rickettsia rhipicephali]ALN41790.1 guanosine polyphosphate pyrophosphohydrolase [Rickettsia rhipicephali]ALN41805.1 guanosine polyphosphate pyrophosphohydrolase [Rickettsia rhipicephali]